jgi:dihydroflavonol-4-reductase
MNIDKTKPVLLTGATGYLGGQVAKRLLEEGLKVHAPVRDPDDRNKTKYLDEIADKSPGSIRYFKADLLANGSYDAAMEGCELVIHTASPFTIATKNPQKDLIEPAVRGTENVMKSVQKIESVKRVVLTSSCAAIYGDAKDVVDDHGGTITEEQWNTTSSLKHNPYSYSKTLAEKKAWEMAGGHDRFDLVVINPSLILGPGLNPNATSETFKIMKQFGDGSMKMGAADIHIGMVDVRDVAEAHFRAGYTSSAKGRHICSAEDQSFLGIADMLRPKFGESYPLPKKNLPKWLVWLTGPMAGIPRKFVSTNVGYPWHADNSKIKDELDMSFRPVSEGVNQQFQQLIDNGAFSKS